MEGIVSFGSVAAVTARELAVTDGMYRVAMAVLRRHADTAEASIHAVTSVVQTLLAW